MANGFFLGGAAEGMEVANRQALAEKTLADDTNLRTGALQLQERQFGNLQNQQGIERADKLIADTMATVAETVKAATAVGRDPASIQKAVQPLVDSAKAVAGRVGRDPNSLDAQVRALITNPGAVESAVVSGTAAASQAVAQDTAERRLLQQQQSQQGGQPEAELPRRYKTAQEKTTAENALRDDYLKQAKDFITVRDAKNRLDTIEKTGAGDIALVFSYMKLLDPGSTVREGEYATARNAAGVPDRVLALYNRALAGEQLSPKARTDITSQANRFYESAALQHDKLTTRFAGIAKRQGLNVDNVTVDVLPAERPKGKGENKGGGSIPPPPAGFNLIGGQ